MGTLCRYNAVIYDRLKTWVALEQPPAAGYEEVVCEWDDANYLLQLTPQGAVALSLSMPQLHSQLQAHEQWASAYKGVAKMVPPLPSYDITLELNVRMLTRLAPQQQDFWIKELAALRLTVMATPLRQHFQRLADGEPSCGPAQAQRSSREDQVYFVKPQLDSVVVVFPMRFRNEQDCAIGRAFLQEFVEARKAPSLGKAPECGYSQTVPEMLGEAELVNTCANGGYVSFTFSKRHVQGPQMSHVLWSICSFYFFVSSELKHNKAAMHAKMRSAMDKMCSSLGWSDCYA